MTHFLLVPGAWLDGAVFDPVCDRLKQLGHTATAVTLPGLTDESDDDIDLGVWIDHVVHMIERTGSAGRVVLAGHSFSGLVVGPAAARAESLLGGLVFIDANLPEAGQSFADSWSPSGREWLIKQLEDSDGRWPPDLDPSETGLEDEAHAFVCSHAHSMPGKPLFDPVPRDAIPKHTATTYLWCTQSRPELPAVIQQAANDHGWNIVPIDSTHWPMAGDSQPLATALSNV
jgi:pimeloyl-ACP methyl ester carboxylesterase